MVPLKIVIVFIGMNLYAMADVAVTNGDKGDPYGAIAAILFGSFGLGAVTLWQRYKMAENAIEDDRQKRRMESDVAIRKAEMASLNDRIDGQDKYIRDLEIKVRDFATEAMRWKTLYEHLQPVTTVVTTGLPKGSEAK